MIIKTEMPNFLWTPLLFPSLGWQLVYHTEFLSNGCKVEYSKVPIFIEKKTEGLGKWHLLIKLNYFLFYFYSFLCA